jgi:hypothetical protein
MKAVLSRLRMLAIAGGVGIVVVIGAGENDLSILASSISSMVHRVPSKAARTAVDRRLSGRRSRLPGLPPCSC